MKLIRAPAILQKLVMCIYSLPGMHLSMSLDQVEFMAGRRECTKAAWSAGKRAFPFEILSNHTFFDFLSPVGFVTAIVAVLRTRPAAGISPLAPVCSSFVPINLGTSKRSSATPLGDQTLDTSRYGYR